jgi:hypothetical protein
MRNPTSTRRSPTDVKQLTLRHRNLIALLLIDLALLTIAELTYNNAKHPGTVSNVAWYAFLIGAASLVILTIRAIIPRHQSAAR